MEVSFLAGVTEWVFDRHQRFVLALKGVIDSTKTPCSVLALSDEKLVH